MKRLIQLEVFEDDAGGVSYMLNRDKSIPIEPDMRALLLDVVESEAREEVKEGKEE